jgi:hypothetical protein
LSFQRLIDLSRTSNKNALSEIVSRLQQRAVSDEERALLSDEDWEVLRAMNLPVEKLEAARQAFDKRQNGAALKRRAEVLLGFGPSSTSRVGSVSSWS